MDNVIIHYSEKIKKTKYETVFELFSELYELDRTLVDDWLESRFKNKLVKDNAKSIFYREEGNRCFRQRDLLKCLEYYTKSLCWATPYGVEYNLALGNRSAVSFEMNEFEECLKDIDLCLKTAYAMHLRPKIYIRKAECYFRTGQEKKFHKCLRETYQLLSSIDIVEKDKFIKKIQDMEKRKIEPKSTGCNKNNCSRIPEFLDGENSKFACASSKIQMSYDEGRGRHVVAKKPIHRGDILFVEKAFIFAPVFKVDKEFHSFKCYNCLKDVISSIPCQTCTLCVYCSETCRSSSWDDYHRWECEGMQANIWYDLGIGFPALKVLLRGTKTGLRVIDGNYEDDVKQFGNKNDNYHYVNRLVMHVCESTAAPSLVLAIIIVTYLRKYTGFFTWFIQQENCARKGDMNALIKLVGGLIMKHAVQLSCNSSVIEHSKYSSTDFPIPDTLVSIASGIFLSVSIMNHSCKPNVTNFFICDTIIVKALENISEGEEIFNCYGIDYREMSKEERRSACRSLYNFDCNCVICRDPSKELDTLNTYKCSNCNGQIVDVVRSEIGRCVECGKNYSLKDFRKLNVEAHNLLSKDGDKLELLTKCLNIRKNILHKHHRDFGEVYFGLYCYYVQAGDPERIFLFFRLWLDNKKARGGGSSRDIGIRMFEAVLAVLRCFQTGRPKLRRNLKEFLHDVDQMIIEAKDVLKLYFPSNVMDRLSESMGVKRNSNFS